MRKHVLTVTVGDPDRPAPFLALRLGIGEAAAARLVERGAVRAGPRRTVASDRLPVGARLIVRVDEPQQAEGEPAALRVVYEDDDLLVVDKPAGMLSQPSPGEHGSALDVQLARRYPGLHLVHRLDREASGLLVLSRHPKAHAALHNMLLDGTMRRTYVAVAAGRFASPSAIALRIARDPHDVRRRQALPERASGGQPARTLVTPLHAGTVAGQPVTALSVELDTGRTHQIRVHLAAVGHPLVGDLLYGGAPFGRLLLHAWRLALPHPRTGAPLTFEAPWPAEFAAVALAPGTETPPESAPLGSGRPGT